MKVSKLWVNTFFVILISILNFKSFAANIGGIILDKSTNKPIQFVNIIVLGTNLGTSSNEKGEFTLTNISLPVKLILSHIIYSADTISFKEQLSDIKVYLNPSVINLGEVKVSPNGYAKSLIEGALNKLIANAKMAFFSKAFYRQFSFDNNEPIEAQEIIFNTKTNPFRILETSILQGRYAAKKDAKMKFKDFSIYTIGFSILQHETGKGYFYEIDKTREIELVEILEKNNNHKIAKVKIYNKMDGRETILFIDTDNYNLYKFFSTNYDHTVNLPPAHKNKKQKMILEVSFRSINDTSMCLDYTDVNLVVDVGYLGSTTKLELWSHTFFFDYSLEDSKIIGYKYNSTKSDRSAIDKIPYNAELWNGDPVFKRTKEQEEIISTFDKKNSFGKIIENDKK